MGNDNTMQTYQGITRVPPRPDSSEIAVVAAVQNECCAARVEMQALAQCAQLLLARGVNILLQLGTNPVFRGAWHHNSAEVTSVLGNIERIWDTLGRFSDSIRNDANPRELLQLNQRMPGIAQEIAGVLEEILKVAKSNIDDAQSLDNPLDPRNINNVARDLLETLSAEFASEALLSRLNRYHALNRSVQESLQLRIPPMIIQARISLLLFASQESPADAPNVRTATVQDLLAGCCSYECQLPVLRQERDTHSPHITARVPLVTAFVSELYECINDLRGRLFQVCAQSTTQRPNSLCSLIDAEQILNGTLSRAEQSLALAAVACHESRVSAAVKDVSTIVMSFTIPKEAALFTESIRHELVRSLKRLSSEFVPHSLQSLPRVTQMPDGSVQFGLEVAIPTGQHKDQIWSETRDLLAIKAKLQGKSPTADMRSVSLLVRMNDANVISVRIPVLLFECCLSQQREVADDAIQESIRCVIEALSLAQELGNIHTLQFSTNLGGGDYDGRLSYVDMVTSADTSSAPPGPWPFAERWSVVDAVSFLLRNPEANASYRANLALQSQISCSVESFLGKRIRQQLTNLSTHVFIEDLTVGDLIQPATEEPFAGEIFSEEVCLLPALYSLIAQSEDLKKRQEKPRLSIVKASVHQDRSLVRFYLTDSSGGLCGIGTVPKSGEEGYLRIFTPEMTNKFADLIAALEEPRMPHSARHHNAWHIRLIDRLKDAGFALGLNFIRTLFTEQEVSIAPVSRERIAKLLYSQIAVSAERIVVSLQDGKLSIMGKSERGM